jgi:hypothetical protein
MSGVFAHDFPEGIHIIILVFHLLRKAHLI